MNILEENQTIFKIKFNPKAYFSFARSKQKPNARIWSFIDPKTGKANHSPEFAASVLSSQYISVFVEPREDWKVKDSGKFFDIPESPSSSTAPSLSDIQGACLELRSCSSPGADGVPASLPILVVRSFQDPLYSGEHL